METLDLDVLIF